MKRVTLKEETFVDDETLNNSRSSNQQTSQFPMGKIAEKAACMSVFLTTWHCI